MATVIIAVSNGARRSALSLVLHGSGHIVDAVGDADALVKAVEKRTPDILFIDPGLARLAVVEPVRKLRESGALARTRLVIVDDPLAPVQGWASLARQVAGGVLSDISKESILRAVASAEGLMAAAGGASPAAPPPTARASGAQTGAVRLTKPSPPNSSSTGMFRAFKPGLDPSSTGAFRAFVAEKGPAPAVSRAAEAKPGVPRILVVEDSPTVRAITGIRLEEAGWAVSWAGSSEEAQTLLAASPFEAILADIALPGMSGDQFVLVARKLRPGIRCMLMTARARSQWPRMPDDIPIFAKPLDMELLRRELDSIKMMLDGV